MHVAARQAIEISTDVLVVLGGNFLRVFREVVDGGRAAWFTGKMIEPAAVEAIGQVAAAAEAIVIWDAAVAPWVLDERRYRLLGALPDATERTVTIGTVWAGAGVEGWL